MCGPNIQGQHSPGKIYKLLVTKTYFWLYNQRAVLVSVCKHLVIKTAPCSFQTFIKNTTIMVIVISVAGRVLIIDIEIILSEKGIFKKSKS